MPMQSIKRITPPFSHRLAISLGLVFFILASVYSVITPIFETPDELWHYPYVWHLARTWQLPRQNPAQPDLWKQEGSQPPLYYAVAALFTSPVSTEDLLELITPNPHAAIGLISPDGNANVVVHSDREAWPWQGATLAIHLSRFLSIALATGTVLTVYLISLTLWPDHGAFALAAMAFVAFNPMFLYISASVNNDNLITLLAALVLWRLVALVSGHARPLAWQFITLGLLIGLATLAKFSGLGLMALTGITLLVWGGLRRNWRIAFGYNALVGVLVITVGGWWYWRNHLLYGDWTGTNNMVAMMGARPVTPTIPQLFSELSSLTRSFWGLFGYFSVPMPEPVYWLYNLIFAAGFIGWVLIAVRPNRGPFVPNGLRKTWPVLVGWTLVMLGGFIYWTLRTPATQGRLLFPALAAIAPLWATGWLALVPNRLVPLAGVLMFSASLWIPWGVIGPAYDRPVPVTVLPADVEPVNATFDQTVTLLGFETPVSTVRPGQGLPVRLYWRAEATTDTNYSLFLHLVDEHDLIIAQRDVFHGPGVFPSSQWSPGIQFSDTYVVAIPATTYAPTSARLVVGLYDHTTGTRLRLPDGTNSISFGLVDIRANPGTLPNPQQLQFSDGISLAGFELSARAINPGETLTVTLYWQANTAPSQDYKVFVHLIGQDGQRVAQRDTDPQNGAAPTGRWQPGQIVVDSHSLDISPGTAPGAYHFQVGLYDRETGQRLPIQKMDGVWVQGDVASLPGVRIYESLPADDCVNCE